MRPTVVLHLLIGLLVGVRHAPQRTERGLSQSAEIAILIAGAAVVAIFLGNFILGYVKGKLP